jgi:hypothetical protein
MAARAPAAAKAKAAKTKAKAPATKVKARPKPPKGEALPPPFQVAGRALLPHIYPDDPERWIELITSEDSPVPSMRPNGDNRCVPTAEQALLAFRLVHVHAGASAPGAPEELAVPPHELADTLAQVAFESHRMDELHARTGRDFLDRVYNAAVSPDTKHWHGDHEDYVHKSKNKIGQVRNQPDNAEHVMLSRRRIVEAARQRHQRNRNVCFPWAPEPSLTHVEPTLAKSADAQNVPIVESLLYDSELQIELVREGNARDAMVLRVMGHAHQAWDMPHLTSHARTYRHQNLEALLWAAVGPSLDDVFVMSKSASKGTVVLGFTTEVLFVMLANMEARQQLLEHAPGGMLALVERSLSTDDLESEFGMIVNGIGFKAAFEVVALFLANIDFLYFVRRRGMELYGLTLPKSTKSHYSWHDAARRGDTAWRDGLFLTAAGGDAYARHIAVKIGYALNALGLKRDQAIRRFHEMRL